MHSRCCWPPESARPDCLSLSLTSSHRAARCSDSLDELVERRPLDAVDAAGRTRRCRRSTSGTGSASGRPCRSAGGARRVDVRRRRCPGRRAGSRPRPGAGIRSFIRLKQRRNVLLPQPDGPMSAVIASAREFRARRPVRAPASRRSRSRRPRAEIIGCAVPTRRAVRIGPISKNRRWPQRTASGRIGALASLGTRT